MTDVVLGIDIGTSGVRIAATDAHNKLRAMATAPVLAPITDFGRAWQDPQLWWNATLAAFAASQYCAFTDAGAAPLDAWRTPAQARLRA